MMSRNPEAMTVCTETLILLARAETSKKAQSSPEGAARWPMR